jgi:hypothetical protein
VMYEFIVVSVFYWLVAASLAVWMPMCPSLKYLMLTLFIRSLHLQCLVVPESITGHLLLQGLSMDVSAVGLLDGGIHLRGYAPLVKFTTQRFER